MYTVIGSSSTRAFRVIWMLEELGLDYEHRPVPPHDAAVLEHNPSGKVPVLLDGDEAMSDSMAILTFLADRHGAMTAGPGTPARARQDALSMTILDELDACLWMAARHSFILPRERRLPQVKDSLKWEFAGALERLAGRIEGPFLAGSEMTVPDILAGHCATWAGRAKFPVENDRFAAYAAMLAERPAFARAVGRP